MPRVSRGKPYTRKRCSAASRVSSGGRVADPGAAPLLLDAPLLHQVEHRRAAGQEEERHAEEVRHHVEGDEPRAEPRLWRGLAEEVRAEEERQAERGHQEPQRVDAEAAAEREVRGRREEGGHREDEMNGANRTDVGDEAGLGHVRRVPERRPREQAGGELHPRGRLRGRAPPRRDAGDVQVEQRAGCPIEKHGHGERQGRDQLLHGRLP